MAKVLLIGDGARENALAEALGKSSKGYKVYALSTYTNPGIKEVVNNTGGKYYLGNILSPEEVRRVIKDTSPDFGVVGPEDPLFEGIANVFREEGIPVVGPDKEDAMIEKSKVWMRQLMWKYEIPGRLRFKAFNNLEEASKFILDFGGSIAIKPSEQVGGKGVKVVADLQAYLSEEKRNALSKGVDRIAGLVKDDVKLIIEEKVDGPEYTLHVLTDGYSYLPLPLAQDYKNAYEDGIGPETGGMGSISGPSWSLPFINEEEYSKSLDIVRLTAEAIKKETGKDYIGILSGQMMLTGLWGPTIIEYYSRLGDPEASAIIPRLEGDFGEILEMVATRHLSKAKINVTEKPSIVRAVAPLGYPLDKKMASGHKISLDLPKMREIGCKVYFGSVAIEGMSLVTKGSRALELVVIDEFNNASKRLDQCFSMISSDTKLIYRHDIGNSIDTQVEKAEIVRYTYKARERAGILGVSADWSPNGGLW
ncbi:phosphoribosylamine--glycine ligase [Stygiolobus caldivivus]|uniref:phosphoribosylamine--glycine ligase n=1 Tax=Stygiolobus caldivivus TaxID=2824673 RepID=A0A8D5ZKH8_9CREN|nr:phosphoribosylamine--glycine ligase [Stygiolobus caldivivus]BCU71400.1 phosphoribosylamine--glycine ligase [Stygiolobus caldivivus]